MNPNTTTDPRGFASHASSRPAAPTAAAPLNRGTPSELVSSLAEVKGQAQFLLYLADQIDDCLQQLSAEQDTGNAAFLCRLLSMYSSQLETKHQGLGEKIAETCQEVYAAVREMDLEE